MLFSSGEDIDAVDSEGNSALHLAAANGSAEGVAALVVGGACIDCCNVNGQTPLMQAARCCNMQIVDILLRAGADTELKNVFGCNALSLACSAGGVSVVKKLLGAMQEPLQNQIFPLLVAAHCKQAEVTQVLLNRGLDPNCCHPATGMTPLMVATMSGCFGSVELLLAANADANAVNVLGMKALHLLPTASLNDAGDGDHTQLDHIDQVHNIVYFS